MQFRCPHCTFSFLSEYRIGRQEKSKVPLKHRFTFWLSRTARNKLFAYVQSVRCTEAQAVRAVFRRVLTGKVFWTIWGTSPRSRLLSRIARDPSAAAMRFPSAHREAVRRMKYPGGVAVGRFQPTILGAYRMTVMLDDAAKEGLVYAMRFLDLNHADAARWLLTNAEVPGPASVDKFG